MRKNTIWNVIYVLLFLLLAAGEAFAIITLIQLDMLPLGYLIALIAVLVLLAVIIGLMLFIRGRKSGKLRRIVAVVLALLLLCGCAVISTVATDVRKAIQATSREMFDLPTREIYVLADNETQELKDAVDFTYGFIKNYDEDCTQQVFEEIYQQTGVRPATAGYMNIGTMVTALMENRIDAMILNSGLMSILEDSGAFEDFSANTKVLEQVRVEELEAPTFEMMLPVPQEPDAEEIIPVTQPEEEPEEEITVDYSALEPFIVYVSGSDSYDEEVVTYGRSDVNILAVVNPLTKQVLLINTPRDYYVKTTVSGDQKDKLTHCGIYGVKCSMRTLASLYNTKVEYFVRINFSGFKKLIDALGGVTVYSDYAFTAITRTPIAQGENHLNGQQALDFARERKTLQDGDAERGRHQMQVITAVIEKATSGTTIISNYSDIMASVEGMFTMNIPAEMIGDLMKMQLSDMARWNIVSYSATGYGAMEECYSLPGMELAVMEPNQSSLNKAARLIDMVFAGELLTEEVINSIT